MKRIAINRSLRLSLGALALVALTISWASKANATHEPADKVEAAASVVEVMRNQAGADEVTLLTGTLRTSSPTDLVIQVTAETGLYTAVSIFGTAESEARTRVTVWTEIDGQPVPVSHDSNGDGVFNDPDDGKVVFNNRDFGLAAINLSAVLTAYQRTRSANAFNWVALDVGPGIHQIAVKARLEVQNFGAASSAAAVGKRVMVVEPAKLANDASI